MHFLASAIILFCTCVVFVACQDASSEEISTRYVETAPRRSVWKENEERHQTTSAEQKRESTEYEHSQTYKNDEQKTLFPYPNEVMPQKHQQQQKQPPIQQLSQRQQLGHEQPQYLAQPSAQYSVQPLAQYPAQPSAQPLAQPSAQPPVQTSALPSAQPSAQPSIQPPFNQNADFTAIMNAVAASPQNRIPTALSGNSMFSNWLFVDPEVMQYQRKIAQRLMRSQSMAFRPEVQQQIHTLATEKLSLCKSITPSPVAIYDKNCLGRTTGYFMSLINAVENTNRNYIIPAFNMNMGYPLVYPRY